MIRGRGHAAMLEQKARARVTTRGDRAGQEERHGTSRTHSAEQRVPGRGAAAGARKAELDADIDSVLDEIDSVLETNAADFVTNFVQKGGQ